MIKHSCRSHLIGLILMFFTATIAFSSPMNEQSTELVVQGFIDYLLKPKTDIASDTSAQIKWLTTNLRKLLVDTTKAVTEARKLPDVEGPDPMVPDNGTFLASWDYPTTCLALKPSKTSQQTRVKAVCNWGPNTDYPGTTRNATFYLERESGAWRIFDIQFHKSKYADENNLIRDLESLKAEADALINRPK